MKFRTLIQFGVIALCFGSMTPASAAPVWDQPAIGAFNAPLLLANRGDSRDNRQRAERRDNGGDNRRQSDGEARRDQRQEGFGYGYERRQERNSDGNRGRY
jgi:hypothetical protein